ncbi:MAG: MFS transporter [Planctomycetia bacterium]|nr:MFS transporter [Planctomycetia bacterium]
MPAEAPTRVRFAVLCWLCAGALLAYLHRFCISVPYETIRDDLLLTPRKMNLVLGSFFAGYSLLQIPSGWLGDRWGSRRALALFAAVWSVATACMGLADGFLVALAAWVVNGIGQAGIFPCCVKSISHWFPASGRGFANGMLTSFMAIGSVAAGALIGELLVYFSWREVVLMVALPGVVYAIGFYAWFRDRPADHAGVNLAERRLIQGDRAAAAQPSLPAQPTPWQTILSSPTMLLLCSQQFFRAMAIAFFGTLFPMFLQKQYAVSVSGSGRMISLVVVASVIGASIGGALADFIFRRTDSLKHSRRGVALGSLLSCAGLLVLAWLVDDLPITFALIVASTFCSGFCGPIAYTITIDLGGRHVATVFSTMNMVGNIGAFVFPLVAGELAESVGWRSVLLLVAGLNFAALLSWIFLNVERPIVEKPD